MKAEADGPLDWSLNLPTFDSEEISEQISDQISTGLEMLGRLISQEPDSERVAELRAQYGDVLPAPPAEWDLAPLAADRAELHEEMAIRLEPSPRGMLIARPL